MKFQDRLTDGVAVFELSGKIMEANDATPFRGRLHEYLDLKISKFVIDMSRVEWLTSVGIGMLIRAYRAVTDAGGQLVLTNVEGKSEQLITITRLSGTIASFNSTEEALKALDNK